MSSGVFSRVTYETDNGDKVPLRCQPETLEATIGGAANAGATGSPDPGWPSASIGKSKTSNGIHARFVTIYLAVTPLGYKDAQVFRVVCPKKSVWDGAVKGATATYLGLSGVIISKTPEIIV